MGLRHDYHSSSQQEDRQRGKSNDTIFNANRNAIAAHLTPSKGKTNSVPGSQQRQQRGKSDNAAFNANRNAIAAHLTPIKGKTNSVPGPQQRQQRGKSDDAAFNANRNAIAAHLRPAARKDPHSRSNTNKKKAPNKQQPLAASRPTSSSVEEFENLKAAVASKLNFRSPLPASDPRARSSTSPPHQSAPRPPPSSRPARVDPQDYVGHRAAVASELQREKATTTSTRPTPPSRANKNAGSDFVNQRAALASKLVFRPLTLPAAPTSRGSPPTETPLQQQTSPVAMMSLGQEADVVASKFKSRSEDAASTGSSSQPAVISRSMTPPPKPDIHKTNSQNTEPEMTYVRSYRIEGEEHPKAMEHKPTTQVIANDTIGGVENNGHMHVVLVSQKYEWGTKSISKGKHFHTLSVKKQKRLKKNKNKKNGICTIM